MTNDQHDQPPTPVNDPHGIVSLLLLGMIVILLVLLIIAIVQSV